MEYCILLAISWLFAKHMCLFVWIYLKSLCLLFVSLFVQINRRTKVLPFHPWFLTLQCFFFFLVWVFICLFVCSNICSLASFFITSWIVIPQVDNYACFICSPSPSYIQHCLKATPWQSPPFILPSLLNQHALSIVLIFNVSTGGRKF